LKIHYRCRAISGTSLFDWDAETITGYEVIQPDLIVVEAEPLKDASVALELDKTKVKVGDIITATIKIENMKNFAGYQLNIKYDPTMLEAIELETGSAIAKRTWPVTGGTVLQSDNYGKTTAVANDVGAGIINFAEAYSNLTKYRETGVAEETGIIGKIGFRVLKQEVRL